MPFGSAPEGNKNAANAKRWQKALEKALARASGDVDAGLVDIADTVVAAARSGDKDAWKEIGDRIDGRSVQMAEIKLTDDRADELSESELHDIARRGSNGTTEAPRGTKTSTGLH